MLEDIEVYMSSNSSLRDAASRNSTCRINEQLPGKKGKDVPRREVLWNAV